MIRRIKEVFAIIRADWRRYASLGAGADSYPALIFTALTARDHCFAYIFWLRLASRRNAFRKLARLVHYRLSRKYGIQIKPSTKIGEGFYIGHGVGIIIHPMTVIGKNCRVSQFLTIGSNHKTPAVIGDNVYIGPHVCIVEDVKIGNNVTIGAGSVVVNDIPDGAVSVGNPNRILNKKEGAL